MGSNPAGITNSATFVLFWRECWVFQRHQHLWGTYVQPQRYYQASVFWRQTKRCPILQSCGVKQTYLNVNLPNWCWFSVVCARLFLLVAVLEYGHTLRPNLVVFFAEVFTVLQDVCSFFDLTLYVLGRTSWLRTLGLDLGTCVLEFITADVLSSLYSNASL